MRISFKKRAAGGVGLLLVSLLLVGSAPVLAASSFSDHLWQFVGGSTTNLIDFNKGSSRIFDENQLYVSTDDWLYLQAGAKVIVRSNLAVAGHIQGASLDTGGDAVVHGALTVGGPTTGNGGFMGNLTGNVTGNLTGNVTGNTSGSSGSTTGNAATATALAANPADCAANTFATTIAASGALTCAAIVDADVPDTITASNYLLLTGGVVNGTITGLTGLTVASGGATITTGGLTVSAGGAAITGNSTITGTLSGLTGLTVGAAGTSVTQIRVYAQALTPVATAAAIGTTSQTFTVTGLATTDKITVNGPAPTSLCPNVSARVSAADTLQLDFSTLTAAACTPAAGTYSIVAIRS